MSPYDDPHVSAGEIADYQQLTYAAELTGL